MSDHFCDHCICPDPARGLTSPKELESTEDHTVRNVNTIYCSFCSRNYAWQQLLMLVPLPHPPSLFPFPSPPPSPAPSPFLPLPFHTRTHTVKFYERLHNMPILYIQGQLLILPTLRSHLLYNFTQICELFVNLSQLIPRKLGIVTLYPAHQGAKLLLK